MRGRNLETCIGAVISKTIPGKCLVLCACLSNLQNEHVETDSQAHLFTPLKRLSVMEHPPGSRTPLPPAVLEAKTASGSDWHSSERAQNLLLV